MQAVPSVEVLTMKLVSNLSDVTSYLPLFQRQHAVTNMARAKRELTIVQQQSVHFLSFSRTGSCSGRITRSSNIVGAD